ncbi:hypothetical protein B296_00010788 [Ensete ventricosum]|uniref:Cellulose synthase n=1 Tax=Ensete ventricosum TaxID=4639 RepID=A0A427A3A0_ENSVE|nr:hypothetical protein B296_00010788 [Ensete ventricosum]
MIIVIRLVVVGFFFHYRITNPASDAYPLWLISVICEIWFALSWILDQFPKWLPIERETYLDRLSLRYEKEGQPSQLSPLDIFVSTVDPMKEPPLITANTVLSILAVDYPVEKVSCYVSDDGAAMLTFEALSETSEFAKKWVPFCKKFNIEPRAPEWWALGSVEIFLSKHCPLWYGYGGGLKWLERMSYINATVYPWTSIPLLAYCTLPAVCLLTGKFITPEV